MGADEQIDDLESFQYDSLYLQLFDAFFPQLNLSEIQPGESVEEMASNIQTILDLLQSSILDIDLSFISSKGVVEGDLKAIKSFLEIIQEIIYQLAQGEGDEEEESNASPQQQDQQIDMEDELQMEGEDGMMEDGDEMIEHDDQDQLSDKKQDIPNFYGDDQPDQKQVVVDEDDDLGDEPKIEEEEQPQEQEEKIDLFNDPLLPEDDGP